MSDEIEANAPLQSDPTEEVSIDLQREKDSVSAHQADDSGLDKIKDALDRYTELKKEKKPGGALVVLAALLVAVSLFIGITTGLSEMSGGGSGGEGGLGLCFAGLILAGILGTAGFSQAGAHEVKLKKAFKDVSESVNYNEKDDNNTKIHLKISLALIGGGWLLAQPWGGENQIEILLNVGVILFLLGLVWLMFWLVADATNSPANKEKKILAAAKSQLKRKEDS
ncbi:MAG: hypothetical protein ACPHMS_01125 [Candidatus Poseidoniaceae archaeon]|jgi:hypothetical protein